MTITTRSGTARGDGVPKKAKPIKAVATTVSSKGRVTPSATRKSDRKDGSGDEKKKHWNSMSHLVLKRFRDDDPTLTAGARRDRIKHSSVAKAELDPSGRAVCKMCGDRIAKGTLRLCLLLECHKGYRNLCTLHEDCFWQHPETKKLESVNEISMHKELGKFEIERVKERFASCMGN